MFSSADALKIGERISIQRSLNNDNQWCHRVIIKPVLLIVILLFMSF